MLRNLFDDSITANQLVNLERTSAVRALLSLLNQPLSNTISATQLAAARTNYSILNFAEADEALKQLFNVLIGIALLLFSIVPVGDSGVVALNGANVGDSVSISAVIVGN